LIQNLPKLEELHVAGNKLRNLDEIDKARVLRVLNIARNDLVTLPGRLAKLKNLQVLDARFNQLNYDTSNWPDDWNWNWNWNWNLELKHLDFSGNKNFEIASGAANKGGITDFSTLPKLELLGLTDVTVINITLLFVCLFVCLFIYLILYRKGKLGLTQSYLIFGSKSKGFLKQKEKEILGLLVSDIKEVKKVCPSFFLF
jgi:hypothetical protein